MDNMKIVLQSLSVFLERHYIDRVMVQEEMEDYGGFKNLRPFYETINHYLDKQGLTKRILSSRLQDRKSIYHIYHQENYVPTKRLAICIAFCLRLPLEDFKAFLHQSGYHLSPYIRQDVVILFCLENGIYEGVLVDLYLEKVQEKPLFSCYLR